MQPVPAMLIPLLADIPVGVTIITCLSILLGMLIPIVAIISGTRHVQRREQLWHETARIALEKGQPLPPKFEGEDTHWKSKRPQNDFRSGLIMVAVGAGLYLFFSEFAANWLRFIGAIPGFIGLALLLYATLQYLFTRLGGSDTSQP